MGWWTEDVEKRIWLELTDRDDIGMNTVIACK